MHRGVLQKFVSAYEELANGISARLLYEQEDDGRGIEVMRFDSAVVLWVHRGMPECPPNTEISGEGRGIVTIADLVRFISLFDSPLKQAVEENRTLTSYVDRLMAEFYPGHPWPAAGGATISSPILERAAP